MTPEQNAHVKTLATRQEIFNHVIKHLKEQGCQSVDRDGDECAYRGASGRMCAVGCLLADDEYEPNMESHGVYDIVLPLRLENHSLLLQELQRLHDRSYYWNDEGAGGFSHQGEYEIEMIQFKFGLDNARS